MSAAQSQNMFLFAFQETWKELARGRDRVHASVEEDKQPPHQQQPDVRTGQHASVFSVRRVGPRTAVHPTTGAPPSSAGDTARFCATARLGEPPICSRAGRGAEPALF